MSGIAAVILAGGEARRLGGISKAELRIGGRRLIDRVGERLSTCAPVLISVGPQGAPIPGAIGEAEAIFDSSEGHRGPLADLAAAAQRLSTMASPPELVISAAVDTPFLPADYVARLVEGIGDAKAAVATADGQPYPTNAIWRLAALCGALKDLGKERSTGPRAIAAGLGATEIAFPAGIAGNPFANVNTPDELAALELRARNFPNE